MTLYWVTLFIAIAISIAGNALLKAGADAVNFVGQLFDWRTLLGLCLYGGAAILYIVALRRIPLSRALPCTAISYVAAALIGHYTFGEPLGIPHIAAIALICGGVVLLAFA
ncbi:MAG TPA: SMR family transporter [Ktedonobacterales bacterium]|nr:SMR family transporter [Ktedonobacterales bacterium]